MKYARIRSTFISVQFIDWSEQSPHAYCYWACCAERYENCEFDLKCMKSISVEQLLDKIRKNYTTKYE